MRSVVQVYLGPPIEAFSIRSDSLRLVEDLGAVAQLGERGLCKSEVVGSNPISSTKKQVGGSLKASENESASAGLDFL